MSVRQAQEEINSAEFIEWMAFDRMEPGEPLRGDFRAGMLAAMLINLLGDRKGSPVKPVEAVAFLSNEMENLFDPSASLPKPQEVKVKLRAALSMLSTRMKKGKRKP